jgi:hypothetical protein
MMQEIYVPLGSWFEQNTATALALLSGFVFVLTFYIVYLHMRLSKVCNRFRYLLQDVDSKNLEELLISQGIQLREVLRELARVKHRQSDLADEVSGRLTAPTLVRYSAFENTGSDQSFSMAILNSRGDGAALSSLHSRDECRVYAKAIINGESHHTLTEEEKEAVAMAMREIASSKEDLAKIARNNSP